MDNKKAHGFSLVEVTIALGIAAFCLIALFGLLPVGINSTAVATQQTIATSLLASVASDLRAIPNQTTTTGRFKIDVSTPGLKSIFINEDGTTNPSASADFRYRLTYNVILPPSAAPRSATAISIRVTWPAIADPQPGTPPKNYAGIVESYVALNRN